MEAEIGVSSDSGGEFMQPPPLPRLNTSQQEVRWPLMFSSSDEAKSITVSSPASDWRIQSCPWWLNAAAEGDQLHLKPRNCGFYSGKVTIQHGEECVAIRVAASILPSLKPAALGLGTGGLATLLPIGLGAILLLVPLLFMLMMPYLAYPAFLLTLGVAGFLILGPIPLFLACVWGSFLGSGRAWLHSIAGILLGGILALLTYVLVHGTMGTPAPEGWRVFVEVSIISLAWVGSAAICTGGFRMVLPAAASVVVATAIIVTGLSSFTTKAFSRPAPKPPTPTQTTANRGSPVRPEPLERLRAAEAAVRCFGPVALAGIAIQLVFCMSLPLLMIFMFPIPVPKQRPLDRKFFSSTSICVH